MRDYSPRRSIGRLPRNVVLVVTEGRTEEIYFRGLKRRACDVEIRTPSSSPTDALNLVKLSVRHIKGDDVVPENGDLVICAFDVEGNAQANLDQAVRMAEEHGIMLAISNPCFELWTLFHFRGVDHRLSCREAQAILSEHIPGYRKGDDHRIILTPRRTKASTRAMNLQERFGAPTPRRLLECNPCTNMNLVIDAIEGLMARNARFSL